MNKINAMQVVVLMGGIGSRLEGATRNIPKPMLPIHGAPFFLYEFKLLLAAGFKRFLFLVGYRADQIEQYFGDGSGFGAAIDYCYDGPEQLGTGGAIVHALDKIDADFMLIYGDTLLDIDYFEVIYRFWKGKECGHQALMTVFHNEGNLDTSNVIVENGKITKYSKREFSPWMEYIDYGISVFEKAVFENHPWGEKIDLSDIQTQLVDNGKMTTCIIRKRFYEIGTPKTLGFFKEYAKKRYFTENKAVFIDRDGVVNQIVFNEDTERLDSPLSIQEFEFIHGAMDGLKILQRKGYLLFIVTNQPAAAKGKTKLATLYDINGFMLDRLMEEDIEIDGLQMCPHHPKGSPRAQDQFLIKECKCRKPGTKMIDDILHKYCIDKDNSYMIGDSFTDVMAGKSAGLKTAYVGDFKCDVCQRLNQNKPDLMGKDLREIAQML